MTVRTWRTPAEQLRRGVPADRVPCEEPGCPNPWDGEAAVSGRPVCAVHRAQSSALLHAAIDVVLRDLAADTDARQPA